VRKPNYIVTIIQRTRNAKSSGPIQRVMVLPKLHKFILEVKRKAIQKVKLHLNLTILS
jgi:hypothetical protein